MNTSKKSKTKFFKFNLNRSIMKNNYGKLGLLALTMIAATASVQAQDTNATIGKQAKATLGDVTTNVTATPGADAFTAPTAGATTQGGHIRVIDNKGTIKYLQVKNGLTQVTDTAPDGGIVTTWQLGGQLANDTDIDFNGNVFSFNNVLQVDNTDLTNGVPATTFTTASGQGNTGWAILVRDEGTGEVKKLNATDLIVSGVQTYTASAADQSANALVAPINVPGMSPQASKIWVYRNGAKLLAGVDYTVVAGAVLNTTDITFVPNVTEPADWAVFTGDIFEMQWFK